MNAKHPTTIKGLLFDKDGTLFDYHSTWGPWAEGFISQLSNDDPELTVVLANALEFDLSAKQFYPESHFIAGTSEQFMTSVLAAVPNLKKGELEKLYYDSTAKAALAPPVPLAPLFEGLAQSGIKLGIATNDHETAAHSQLKKAGVESYFNFIAGFDSGFGAKPEPGMQHAFCRTLGLKPKDVAMVGDSSHDLESGKNAGMLTIGVLTGVALREDLTPLADVVLNHIGEIPDWLTS